MFYEAFFNLEESFREGLFYMQITQNVLLYLHNFHEWGQMHESNTNVTHPISFSTVYVQLRLFTRIQAKMGIWYTFIYLSVLKETWGSCVANKLL